MLTSNSKVIFSSQNTDTEFIACLTHWLLVAGMQAKSQHRKFSFSVIDLVDKQDEKYGKTQSTFICSKLAVEGVKYV